MTWQSALVARKAAWLAGEAMVCCVGNCAGDLDSIVSAIGAAHLLHGVALAPCRRDELSLRRDAAALLAFCGLDGSELADKDEGPCRVVALTDHNGLDEREFPGAEVIAIFDHHADEGCHLDADPRDVDPAAGSACTLVAERLLPSHDEALPTSLFVLLFATIALDTRGFDPAKHKYSPRDLRVAHRLLDAIDDDTENEKKREEDDDDEQALLQRLRTRCLSESLAFRGAATVPDLARALADARHDVGDLTAAQLLRLDLKRATFRAGGRQYDVGFAGCLVDLDRLAAKTDDMRALLLDLAAERGLSVVVVMTAAADKTAGAAKKKKKKAERKKALLYLIVSSNHDRHGLLLPEGLGPNLEAALRQVPAFLPAELAELPLFATQGIREAGFQLSAFADFGDGGVRFSLFPKTITRKTVLPALLYFAAAEAGALLEKEGP